MASAQSPGGGRYPPAAVIHESSVRVRYGEVDRMGVAYHAHYLVWFEVGRTEFLRSLGHAYKDVEDGGVFLVVAEAGARFLRPAEYDDLLHVRTRLASVSGVRLRFEYEVVRPSDGARVATGHTTLASTDREGRPGRLPAAFRTLLSSLVEGPVSAGEPTSGKKGAAPAVQGHRP